MSYSNFIVFALIAILAAGCGSAPIADPEPTDTTYGDDDTFSRGGAGDDDIYGGGPDMDEGPDSVIYFDFDSYEVRPEDQDTVRRHAMQMGNDSRLVVRLEGHADERGSREYNIGLGERRAQAVRQALMVQGVNGMQIKTVSFGEERPASMGSSESDYALNRRVQFEYEN